ncbi:DUF5617 domain-containing protein [Legionella dresdenensis]|uniref:DUF5617 domain-containing protein n=1 Tax=Legionella dresdenensis TaxID=450200 RepID=A0ABV8CFT3_9GAMM
MPDLKQKLRGIIDSQNSERLKKFLQKHRDFDVNSITANNLSALQWALFPVNNQPISTDIIQCLITDGRVDPISAYNDNRMRLIHLLPQTARQIKSLIEKYEGQYHRQVPANAELGAPHLAQIAADGQNTHDSRIVAAVDKSIAKLFKRYCAAPAVQPTLQEWLETLNKDELDANDLETANTAIKRIAGDLTNRTYLLDNNEKVTLTNMQVLDLLWHAVNDTEPLHFVIGVEMTAEEIENRKKRLITHLITSQKEYGPNNPACWMGTRNQIVSSMDATHIDVEISQKVPLDAQNIGHQYRAFCRERLEVLEKNDPALFWKYVEFFTLKNDLGVNFDEVSIPEALKQWRIDIHTCFVKLITEQNAELAVSLQMPAEKLDNLLLVFKNDSDPKIDYIALEHNLHEPLRSLGNISQILSLPSAQNLFQAGGLLINLINQIIAAGVKSQLTCEQILTQITACLMQQLKSAQELKELLIGHAHTGNAWQSNFASWSEDQKERWLTRNRQIFVDYLKQGMHFSNNPERFYELLAEELAEAHPKHKDWLGSLPPALRQKFLTEVLADYPFKKSADEQITNLAFAFGLAHGHLKHLAANQKVVIKKRDLRGIDLSTIDLSKVMFEDCDLRLTDILANETVTSEHLTTSQVDVNARHLWKALDSGKASYVKTVLACKAWKGMANPLLSPRRMYRNELSHAIRTSAPEVAKEIIASQWCTGEVLRLNDTLSTALINNDSVACAILDHPSFKGYQIGYSHWSIAMLSDICPNARLKMLAIADSKAFNISTSIKWTFSSQGLLHSHAVFHKSLLSVQTGSLLHNEVFITRYWLQQIIQQSTSSQNLQAGLAVIASPYCSNEHLGKIKAVIRGNNISSCWKNAIDQAIASTEKRNRTPNSYRKIYNNPAYTTSMDKAVALLKDYIKEANYIPAGVNRFFHLHWNRHHTDEIWLIISQVKKGEYKSIEELMVRLHQVYNQPIGGKFNPTGSLARRISFIMQQYTEERMQLKAEQRVEQPTMM